MKKLLRLLPELYFIAATLYYWLLTNTLLNPVAIVLLSVLALIIIYKKPLLGFVIALLIVLANLYLVLALVSEASEFTAPSVEKTQLIVFGSLFLGGNILMGIFMGWKHSKKLLHTS